MDASCPEEDAFIPFGKSVPAGLPSGFQSNVTARNQFSKVQTKPSIVSNNEEHQRYFPRDASGSDSSPYGGVRAGGGEVETNNTLQLQQQDVIQERQENIYSKKGGFTPGAAFNRFASDKNLLGK